MLNGSVIIVEDDGNLRELIELQLAKLGHCVIGAYAEGEAALRAMSESAAAGVAPDAAIIDIRIPGEMDGVEFSRLLLKQFHLAIIFITGVEDQQTIDRAFALKPMAYLLKPFTANQLHVTLQAALYQRQIEDELQESNRRLEGEIERRRLLARQVEEVAERERERLGQDLHDDLGQILTGMAIKAQVMKSRLAKTAAPEVEIADELVKLSNQATTQVRDMSRMLYPLVLKSKGIGPALAEMAAYMEGHVGVKCTVACDPVPDLKNDLVTATNLYRIAQEAVTNAVRHGSATSIEVVLRHLSDKLVLSISDNGVGMDVAASSGRGMGLQTMRYRAQLLEANLELQSRPAKGTRVTCAVPVRQPATEGVDGAR